MAIRSSSNSSCACSQKSTMIPSSAPTGVFRSAVREIPTATKLSYNSLIGSCGVLPDRRSPPRLSNAASTFSPVFALVVSVVLVGDLRQVRRLKLEFPLQVRLVANENQGDVLHDLEEGRDPIPLQVVEGLPPSQVRDEEGAVDAGERPRVEGGVALAAQHIPDHEGEVHGLVRGLDSQLLSRDLAPDRHDVRVLEDVEDESAGKARLADRAVPEE